MIQYKINSLILKDSFRPHEMIKHDLLELINKSNDKSWVKKDYNQKNSSFGVAQLNNLSKRF